MGQRAIVYARVSTTRQADHDLSIPDQIAHAEQYCADRNIAIVGQYIDPGASARDDNRPEFQRMIADVKSGAVTADLILVHSFSRFFRENFGSAFYGRELGKHGVQVISMTQETGEGAQGELMRQIISSFDEYQSAENGKHVTRSMLENARRGFWNGSRPPFGYRTYVAERIGTKDKKKLEIEPKEAEIVKLIFQLYVYGDGKTGPLGIKNIVSYLSDKGLTQRNGRPFRIQIVHDILTRVTYIGTYYFNMRDSRTKHLKPREEWVPIDVPAIVEEEVFHAAQAQLKARHPKNMAPRIANSDILLTGVARCGHCGSPMRLRTGKYGQYRYYTCSKQADQGKKACRGITIPMAKLDDAVTEAICGRVLQPERLEEIVGSLIARNSDRREKARKDLKELHKQRREVKTQIDNLMEVIEKGGLAGARSINERFAKRQSEYDELTRLIAFKERELDAPIADVTPDRLNSFARALRNRLREKDSPKFRRAYIRMMLDKVVVAEDGIRISGPKAVLAQQVSSEKTVSPSMVPTFVQGWRAGEDSNSRPPDS